MLTGQQVTRASVYNSVCDLLQVSRIYYMYQDNVATWKILKESARYMGIHLSTDLRQRLPTLGFDFRAHLEQHIDWFSASVETFQMNSVVAVHAPFPFPVLHYQDIQLFRLHDYMACGC
ncbi:hypothetical protein V7S43_014106 [Phytophthora oleae]|uniref:Uncharacterized protein n=1 Tax=Phytophthora oleae TaxID=2107226 RepID=A0ABD3F1L9_9STRA